MAALDPSALVPSPERLTRLENYLHLDWDDEADADARTKMIARVTESYGTAVAYLYYAGAPPNTADAVYTALYDEVVNGMVLQMVDPQFSDKETGTGTGLDLGVRMKLNQLKMVASLSNLDPDTTTISTT